MKHWKPSACCYPASNREINKSHITAYICQKATGFNLTKVVAGVIVFETRDNLETYIAEKKAKRLPFSTFPFCCCSW
jgi:hypothetical protein